MSMEMQRTTVPAGSSTGIFYLILAGLSFRIRWQDLIDHAARHDIYVECAVVYPKLGGWLRILDRETFIKAFDVFSHAEIKGNPILADSRNDKEAVTLLSPPPPLRQSLRSHHFNLKSSLPSPTAPSFPNNLYGNLLPGYPTMPLPCRQLSPVDVTTQLYFGEPISLVPIYSFNVGEQAINTQYISCVQPQPPVGSSAHWQDDYGGYGTAAYPMTGGVGSPNYIAASPTKHSASSHKHRTKSEARIKHRSNTLDAPPDRRHSRTPVVVNGSRSSHGHKSRNSC